MSRFVLKCLWIARELPFPLDAGDRIYTARMSAALAETGAHVRLLGHGAVNANDIPKDWPVEWRAVTGGRQSNKIALFNPLPLNAAVHATRAYREALDAQLRERWDMVVIDSYGSGWALESCLRARRGDSPAIVYLSHNHEESLWRSMARESGGSMPKRIALWQNSLKVKALERNLARRADLISAITAEDAELYARQTGGKPTVALTPGYTGEPMPPRLIDADTPRRVVLVGSFRWVVKQENLRRFLDVADTRFAEAGIGFDVIGDVPPEFLAELRSNYRSAVFHGFAKEIAPHFEGARIAIVPEMIGGGFKLKYLDYIFSRLPVATISDAAAGLPSDVRQNLLCANSLKELADVIVAMIDDVAGLNRMQQQAFDAAQSAFRWSDRGQQLREAVEQLSVPERSAA